MTGSATASDQADRVPDPLDHGPDPLDRLLERLDQQAERLASSAPELGPLRATARLDQLPIGKVEAFKYTPVEALYEPLLSKAPASSTAVETPSGKLRVDGHALLAIKHETNELPEGLTRQTLAEAISDPQTLNAELDGHRYPLTELNTALLESGYLIRVDAGCDPGAVLSLDWDALSSSGASSGASSEAAPRCARVILDVQPGARVELVETVRSMGPANSVLEIRLGHGASLSHVRWQERSSRAAWAMTSATLAANASYRLDTYALGGRPHRNDYHVRLQGGGATFDLNGAHLAYGGDRLDQQVVVEHQSPDGRSCQTLSGIGAQKSRLSFNGRIHIHPGAQRTDARLTNRNLQLDNRAQINTKPELEIYADDVQCAHGATVGQLDEAALFYLRSRGIGLAEARRMLIRGFIHGRLPTGELGDRLGALLDAELVALDAAAAQAEE